MDEEEQVALHLLTQIERLHEENERLREALEPFVAVLEHDIGDDEVDSDYYRQPASLRWVSAPLKIGDFRRARAALKETSND